MGNLSTFDLVHTLISICRMLLAPYIFVYGWVLIATFHLQQAYGTRIAGYGIAYLLFGLNEAVSTSIGFFGIRRHNKAALFIHLLLDLVVGVLQLGCGSGLLRIIKPTVPYEVQYDCMLREPLMTQRDVCTEFLTSDRTMGFRTAWYSYYTQSIRSAVNYQILYNVQHRNGCCGFGPPEGCAVDDRPLPGTSPLYALANEFKKQRQVCGVQETWYTGAARCNKVVDYDAAVWVYGGCQYDHPVGGCSNLEVSENSIGCIPYFEQFMARKVHVHGQMLLIDNGLKYVAWVMALLIWLRRKDHDGIPRIFVTPEPPPYMVFRILDKLKGRAAREVEGVAASRDGEAKAEGPGLA